VSIPFSTAALLKITSSSVTMNERNAWYSGRCYFTIAIELWARVVDRSSVAQPSLSGRSCELLSRSLAPTEPAVLALAVHVRTWHMTAVQPELVIFGRGIAAALGTSIGDLEWLHDGSSLFCPVNQGRDRTRSLTWAETVAERAEPVRSENASPRPESTTIRRWPARTSTLRWGRTSPHRQRRPHLHREVGDGSDEDHHHIGDIWPEAQRKRGALLDSVAPELALGANNPTAKSPFRSGPAPTACTRLRDLDRPGARVWSSAFDFTGRHPPLSMAPVISPAWPWRSGSQKDPLAKPAVGHIPRQREVRVAFQLEGTALGDVVPKGRALASL
jgi:hypothetical protein